MCGPKVVTWVGDILKDMCQLDFLYMTWNLNFKHPGNFQGPLTIKLTYIFQVIGTSKSLKKTNSRKQRANLIWKHLEVMRTIHPLMIQHMKMGEYVKFTQTRHEFLTTRHTSSTFQVWDSKKMPNNSHKVYVKRIGGLKFCHSNLRNLHSPFEHWRCLHL